MDDILVDKITQFMEKYPEHRKLLYQWRKGYNINNFIHWLVSTKNVVLCMRKEDEHCDVTPLNITELISKFLGIDIKKMIEEEKDIRGDMKDLFSLMPDEPDPGLDD
jgi:hypothetical protein